MTRGDVMTNAAMLSSQEEDLLKKELYELSKQSSLLERDLHRSSSDHFKKQHYRQGKDTRQSTNTSGIHNNHSNKRTLSRNHKDENDEDDDEHRPQKRKIMSSISDPTKEEREEGEDQEDTMMQEEDPSNTTNPSDAIAAAPKVRETKEGKQRNRRMFGALMGHLGKAKRQIQNDSTLFKKQEVKETEGDEKDQKQKIKLQGLEKKLIDEKIELDKGLHDKIEVRRSIIRTKLSIARWTRTHKIYSTYLQTVSNPPLYYLPSTHSKETTCLLEASKAAFEEKYEKKNIHDLEVLNALEEEYQELKNRVITPTNARAASGSSEEEEEGDADKKGVDMFGRGDRTKLSGEEDVDEESNSDANDAMEEDEGNARLYTPSKRNNATCAMTPSSLKVSELRLELKSRGLDTKGLKAELISRLEDAVEEE